MNLDPSERLVAAKIALKDAEKLLAEQNWRGFIHHAGAVMGLLRQSIIAAEEQDGRTGRTQAGR